MNAAHITTEKYVTDVEKPERSERHTKMVKSVRCALTVQQIREALTKHARTLPSYKRVVSKDFEVIFYEPTDYLPEGYLTLSLGDRYSPDENEISVHCRIMPQQYKEGNKTKIEIQTIHRDMDEGMAKSMEDKLFSLLRGLFPETQITIPARKSARLPVRAIDKAIIEQMSSANTKKITDFR